MADAASVLTIEEITGKKRKLDLKGAGLPFQGAEWSGSTTLSTTWNAGNPDGVQHVLGPQEAPSSWEGFWRTTQLLASPCVFTDESGMNQPVVFAHALVEILDSLRREGQTMRVTWANVRGNESTASESRQFKIVRIGCLEKAAFKFDRADDVAWSVTFAWTGRGEPPRSTFDLRGDNLLAQLRSSISVQNQIVAENQLSRIRALDQRHNFASTFSLGQLEDMVDAPLKVVDSFARFANSVTDRLQTLGNIVTKLTDLPTAVASRVVDVAVNAVAVCNQFVDDMSRHPMESAAFGDRVSRQLAISRYYGSAQTQAERMAVVNSELAIAVRRRRTVANESTTSPASEATTSDLITVHVPRVGDTFTSLSLRYYQTPDLAGALARANGLPASTISVPRQPIVIPTRAVLDRIEAV